MPVSTSRGTTWRLIETGTRPGAENMAIDEALLHFFDPRSSLPILRLYGWNPPAISLGRFQKAREVLDLERCKGEGVTVVRRITGGGVIYHDEEMTYSIICSPGQIPSASSIKDSFRVLTGFLMAGYRRLGLQPAYAVDTRGIGRLGERTPFCFAGRESFDIMVNGRKLGGNAQRRLKRAIFQHGSIPLQNRAFQGLGYLRDRSSVSAAGACSLADCGVVLTRQQLREYLMAGITDAFGATVLPDALSTREEELAATLAAAKYGNNDWNLEGTFNEPAA